MLDVEVAREQLEEYILSAAEELNELAYEKYTSGEIDQEEMDKLYERLASWREALEGLVLHRSGSDSD